jgi:membrane associated rhomboid family serine protease
VESESVPPDEPATTFSLRGQPVAITLEGEGLHHVTGARWSSPVYTAYRDITHLATSSRAVWLGTRRSVYVIARRTFVDPHGPEHLVRALLARIARQPGGSAQLARMAQIEEIARVRTPLRATMGLLLVCLVLYAAQLFGGGDVEQVGYFTGVLAADGDWWRVVTGNLLHANALHLILNLLGLLAVGSLVELAFGTAGTLCVMACSGVAAMAASAWWSPLPVVGVSGILAGMLAALLWIEFRNCDELPAWWRVPRRALFGVIGVSALLSFLPFVATAAHAGGFAGGAAAAAALSWRGLHRRPAASWVRGLATASVVVTMVAVGAAGYELSRPGEFAARNAVRMLHLPGVSAEELNNTAWAIAVDERSSPEMLAAALELAERAVDDTGHAKAHILDTLAEVHFQLGHRDAAVEAIDEAILRAPDEDYYREQRRRFLGERDREDRPFLPPQPAEPDVKPEDGLSV